MTDAGERVYDISRSGQVVETLHNDAMIHVPDMGFDGLKGISRIANSRNAIGLTAALETFGSSLFKNGLRASGTFEHPAQIGEAAYRNLRNSIEEHTGAGNWLRPLILEEGMKWNQQMIPPEDAQWLESRRFQIAEIARIFGVPPHLIADMDKATFSNIEQQSLDFLMYHLAPTLKKIEQELNRKVFTPLESSAGFFVEFLVDGLLRGDIVSRYNAYQIS